MSDVAAYHVLVCALFPVQGGMWTGRLTFNIPSLARQRCLPSWGPRRTPCFFVISQLFEAVDYSNYVSLGF